MRTFVTNTLLTFGMLLSPASSAETLLPGFVAVELQNPEYKTYDMIRKKAISLIRQAINRPDNGLNAAGVAYGQKIIEKLLVASFAVSINAASEEVCKKSPFFTSSTYKNLIFVCGISRNALRHGKYKDLLMASQLLIHEGAHLVDHEEHNYSHVKYDECGPTWIELTIMGNDFGHKNIPTMVNRDSYKAQCGFEYYDDVPSK